ncbi:MAG: Long-chain-fatty-acid--CoA ligase [Syntrophorhabdus sp. PtaU1.Bin153]|nr:MAG: Long-chain-fatty-acid--CoA ligase [Syntrophorhabdus sp. PtaU1.Bin153]
MIPIKPIDPAISLVHHFLERSVRLYPDKVAIVHGKARVTYSEIDTRADNLAHHLLSMGVQKGDRIALLMENCVEYVISYYGIMKAGAVAVPLNSDLKVEGLQYAINDLEARILISSSRFDKLISGSALNTFGLTHLIRRGSPSPLSSPDNVVAFDSVSHQSSGVDDQEFSTGSRELSDSDLASIIYTSGSTGGPKGVMLTHRNIVDNTFSICQYLHLTEKDIQMCVLPFFYVMGKSLLNTHFAVGGTVVVNNQFAFPATVLKEMITEKVTGFSGVPSTFAYLLHRSPLAVSRDKLASLRYVTQAGGHMSKAIKEQLRRVLPSHTEIVIMYGATEAAARLSYLEPSQFADKMESIGKAIPGVELMVMNEHGKEAAVGEVGELVARGSNIMPGYLNKPEATNKALANGWYHTGDQAYRDEEGFFFVVGRQDDLLKVGGHRLSPQEIEDTLMESGLFVEAVVLGMPDELLGNKLVILAVPSSNSCTSNEVMSFCAGCLPKYKVPSEVRFVKNLPKKTSGKIDRKACLALFMEADRRE